MRIDEKTRQVEEKAPAIGLNSLPLPPLKTLAYRLLPGYWEEEKENPLVDGMVEAALRPVAEALRYATWAKALVDARSAAAEDLPILERWAHMPHQTRNILSELAYRRLLRAFRAVQKGAGIAPAWRALERVYPGLALEVVWHPSIPYRRRVIAQVPLEGLEAESIRWVVRLLVPPSLEVEITTFRPSPLRTASGMPYSWLGVNAWLEPGSGTTVVM